MERKIYWGAICLLSILYVAGISLFPMETILLSLFTSALISLVQFCLRDLRGPRRGIFFISSFFTLMAVALLTAFLYTLKVFTLDIVTIAIVAALSAIYLIDGRGEEDPVSVADSFAVGFLYLIIQLHPYGNNTALFFNALAFAFMSGSTAYKFRSSLGKRWVLIPVVALPLVYLALLYLYPFYVGAISVLFISVPQLLRNE